MHSSFVIHIRKAYWIQVSIQSQGIIFLEVLQGNTKSLKITLGLVNILSCHYSRWRDQVIKSLIAFALSQTSLQSPWGLYWKKAFANGGKRNKQIVVKASPSIGLSNETQNHVRMTLVTLLFVSFLLVDAYFPLYSSQMQKHYTTDVRYKCAKFLTKNAKNAALRKCLPPRTENWYKPLLWGVRQYLQNLSFIGGAWKLSLQTLVLHVQYLVKKRQKKPTYAINTQWMVTCFSSNLVETCFSAMRQYL